LTAVLLPELLVLLPAVLLLELLVLLPAVAGGVAGRLAGACCSRRHAKLFLYSLDTILELILLLGWLHPAATTVNSSRAAQHLAASLLALLAWCTGFDLFIAFYLFVIEPETTLAAARKAVRKISAGYSADISRLSLSRMDAAIIETTRTTCSHTSSGPCADGR
jgi:hypothetical protein